MSTMFCFFSLHKKKKIKTSISPAEWQFFHQPHLSSHHNITCRMTVFHQLRLISHRTEVCRQECIHVHKRVHICLYSKCEIATAHQKKMLLIGIGCHILMYNQPVVPQSASGEFLLALSREGFYCCLCSCWGNSLTYLSRWVVTRAKGRRNAVITSTMKRCLLISGLKLHQATHTTPWSFILVV